MVSLGKKLWALPLLVCTILIAVCTFGFAGCGEETTYKITFDANGGEFAGTTSSATFKLADLKGTDEFTKLLETANQTVKRTASSTHTYEFDGWYTAKDDRGKKVIKVSEAVANGKDSATIYAHWKETQITYSVAFKAGDTTVETFTVNAVEEGTPSLTADQMNQLITKCKNATGFSFTDSAGFFGYWDINLTNDNVQSYNLTGDNAVYKFGNGTETSPYLIADLKSFEAMMTKLDGYYTAYTKSDATDENKTNTLTTAKNTYYKMVADVDFTTYIGNSHSWFVGHLDAKKSDTENYAIKGLNPANFAVGGQGALFVEIWNAEVSNLDIVTGQMIASFAATARGDSVKFSNVDVMNAVGVQSTFITADDNNESAYLFKSTAKSLTFENCTNYANYTSETSYFGIFLGGFAGQNNTVTEDSSLTYTNCVNYGDVVSSDRVGMLYGNSCARNFKYVKDATDNTLSVTGCYNYGTIKAKNFGGFVGFEGNATKVPGFDNLNALVVNGTEGSKTGTFTKIEDVNGTLSINSEGKFVLTATGAEGTESATLPVGNYEVTLVAFAKKDGSTVRVNYTYQANLSEAAGTVEFGLHCDFIDKASYETLNLTNGLGSEATWQQATGYEFKYAFDETNRYIVFDFGDGEFDGYTLSKPDAYIYVVYEENGEMKKASNLKLSGVQQTS